MSEGGAGPLPGFIIVGAAKSATTWLRDQLLARPEVFLPLPEPHFFSREYDRGEGWYRAWFEPAQEGQKIGEKSADYLADPHAAERIHRMIPSARLIVQLRNPIERAYSDYCMFYRRGIVDGQIDRYLESANGLLPRFLNDGLYFTHLSRFLDWFPASRIKVTLYDDICECPEEVVAELETFLGLGECKHRTHLVPEANVKEAPLLPLGLRRTLAPAKPLVAPFRGQRWFKALRGTLASEVIYPPVGEELQRAMQDYFAQDVENLGALLGRDLSCWLACEDLC